MIEHVRFTRHAAGEFEDQAGDRFKRAFGHFKVGEQVPQPVDAGLAVEDDFAVAAALHFGGFGIVLVLNFADDLLDHVFQRHQSSRITVFVNHNRHVDFALLEFLKQRGDRLRFGHEQRLADQIDKLDQRRILDRIDQVLYVYDSL